MTSPPTTKICRVCLVGTGRMGQVRAPHIFAHTRARLSAVVDIARNAGEAMANKYGATYYGSLEAALASDDTIDLVMITTPTFCHADAIKTAAKFGKAIFTEKPVADDEATIEELFQHCAAKNVSLMCGFQRRFDDAYVSLAKAVQAGQIGKVIFARVFFGDYPAPPLDFLLKGGCPFMDLAPHDVDFLRWMLGDEDPVDVYATGSSSCDELRDAGVLDNALMAMRFPGGALCTLSMSRGSTYGYDNRIEVFGDKGMMVVETPQKSTLRVADAKGFHSAPLQYSFPQRFERAFASEVDLAVRVALKEEGAEWPVGARDCTAAQTVASAAAKAQKLGKIVTISSMCKGRDSVNGAASSKGVLVRPIGAGSFGSYVQSIPSMPSYADLARDLCFLPPFTRSSKLDYEKDVLLAQSRGIAEAVYICTPDSLHQPQALECLSRNLHVLVEKPVTPDFAAVAKVRALSPGRVLMVGFHRRYDSEFLRLQDFVTKQLEKSNCYPKTLLIESFDPVPADPNLSFVLRNSCCHDVDLLCWMFPDSKVQWKKEGTKADPKNSAIEIEANIVHPNGSITAVQLHYKKEHASYVQRVTADSRCFGYDHAGPYPSCGGCCALYEEAYAAQLRAFAAQVRTQDEQVQQAQSGSYMRTFSVLEEAAVVLGL